MNFEDLKNPELQEKLKSMKTPEEVLALAKEEGFELSDDQIEAISGGHAWDWMEEHFCRPCEKHFC